MVEKSATPAQITVITNDRGLAGLVRAAGGQVRSATQFALALARPAARPPLDRAEHPEGTDRAPSERKAPRDPAFADIYAGFAAVDKDTVRFGADIDLDPAGWIDRLYGEDVAEASRAARWLGRFGGEPALAPLLDALTHSAGQVRAAAALALADLGVSSAVPTLAERLAHDPSTMVREAAAQALGRFDGPLAEQALRQALADPKSKVRKTAETALTQLRARRGK